VHARVIGKVVGPDGDLVDGVTVTAMRWKRRPDTLDGRSMADGTFAVELPAAGNWEVRVKGETFPTVFEGTRALQAGDTWDLGTIRLSRGGTLVVRTKSETKLQCTVLDTHEQFRTGLNSLLLPLRSELLVPGDYLLLVRGEGIAADIIPFAVEPDKETELEVRPTPGIKQRVEFVHASDTDLPRWVMFEVRRNGKMILLVSARGEPEGPLVGDSFWLAPGSYTLTTRDREPATTATFTVGNEAGPPLRVELR
jgi:hypothetical protein